MTVNDLINILVDGIRKGTISACSPVVMPDAVPVYVVLDSQRDMVYVTDENPEDANGDDREDRDRHGKAAE